MPSMRSSTFQQDLFSPDSFQIPEDRASSTFADNLTLPVHRWFRFPAGFSAHWVRRLIDEQRVSGRTRVLDPFAGSGTVLVEADKAGVEAIGIEAHPFVARVAKAKLNWNQRPLGFREYALQLLSCARKKRGSTGSYPPLIQRCFPTQTLLQLDCLRRAWEDQADGSPFSELAWLALSAILRECSPVGTAQWQYVLPKKKKAKPLIPYEAFETRAYLMTDDMANLQMQRPCGRAKLMRGDARDCVAVPNGWADLVITSPPYTNNYDYADATRLEMTFFKEISRWGDLQEHVRKFILRSCTQHVSNLNGRMDEILENPLLAPIKTQISDVCWRLQKERENHGGKKAYHLMIAAYFEDMALVWKALRRVTHRQSLACLVIGDSAPYGVHVPVERWLGELAVGVGFREFTFERTRPRNVKWKNRKHRVPLQEGRLWVVA